jgi:pantetheine-phosphate adenylyltransferase
MSKKKKCVFAGTFDPPTVGHTEIIDNCLKMFDEVVVAILKNTNKSCVFTVEERLGLLEKIYSDNDRVKVLSFNGAVVDLLEKEGTQFYVRGIRNTIDFEYENQNYFANKKLMNDIVTIYMPARQESLQISSTLVRNSAHFKKDFKEYVPEVIFDDVCELFARKSGK